ncbi:MAG: Rpn family recombination-promoting nuclease/putative transposase [Alphaproteobacteria bacterium]|nr:Rpn family recombination-promoting nuclease/putative transposase [Alphaproteobacteria bacterium]
MSKANQDASYKALFAAPQMMRDLICGFVSDPWLHTLRFETMDTVRSEYIGEQLQQRFSDMVWRVKAADGVTDIYLSLEFQTRPDPAMPLRTWTYSGLFLQQLLGHSARALRQPWPPVLQLVINTGQLRWRDGVDLASRFWRAPSGLLQQPPQHQFVLIDMHDELLDNADQGDNLFGILLQFERATQTDQYVQLIERLGRLLKPDQPLYRSWLNWIRHRVKLSDRTQLVSDAIQTFEELSMNMKSVFENYKKQQRAEGRMEGRMEGLSQGLSQGRLESLSLQMVKRFGPLPADILQKLHLATDADIKQWIENILDARQLSDVFRPFN